MTTALFERFAATSSGRRAATLLADHKVKPHHIFNTVLAEVTHAVPYLQQEWRVTTEILCGQDIWANWSDAERRVAGMCLTFMVKGRMVVLFRHITPSGKGKAKYRTTPPPERAGSRVIKIVRLHISRTGAV